MLRLIISFSLIFALAGQARALQIDSYGANFDVSTYGQPIAVSTQSDGKAILVTNVASGEYSVIRLNIDSSIDSSFNSATISASFLGKPYILPNDGIIIYGRFGSFRGNAAHGIVRLTPSGNTDFMFDSNQYSGLSSAQLVSTVALDYSGDLLVGRPYGIERWESGSDIRDNNFNLRLYRNGSASKPANIIPRIDGRIIVTHSGAWIYGAEGKIDVTGISEFLPDGTGLSSLSIDNGLTSQGSATKASAAFITGSALVSRISSNGTQHTIGKLNFDNSLSSTFNIGLLAGEYPTNRHSPIIVQDDGNFLLLVSNHPFSGGATIKRFSSNGTLDSTFDLQGGVTSNTHSTSHNQFGIQSMAKQDSKNTIVVGEGSRGVRSPISQTVGLMGIGRPDPIA